MYISCDIMSKLQRAVNEQFVFLPGLIPIVNFRLTSSIAPRDPIHGIFLHGLDLAMASIHVDYPYPYYPNYPGGPGGGSALKKRGLGGSNLNLISRHF